MCLLIDPVIIIITETLIACFSKTAEPICQTLADLDNGRTDYDVVVRLHFACVERLACVTVSDGRVTDNQDWSSGFADYKLLHALRSGLVDWPA